MNISQPAWLWNPSIARSGETWAPISISAAIRTTFRHQPQRYSDGDQQQNTWEPQRMAEQQEVESQERRDQNEAFDAGALTPDADDERRDTDMRPVEITVDLLAQQFEHRGRRDECRMRDRTHGPEVLDEVPDHWRNVRQDKCHRQDHPQPRAGDADCRRPPGRVDKVAKRAEARRRQPRQPQSDRQRKCPGPVSIRQERQRRQDQSEACDLQRGPPPSRPVSGTQRRQRGRARQQEKGRRAYHGRGAHYAGGHQGAEKRAGLRPTFEDEIVRAVEVVQSV